MERVNDTQFEQLVQEKRYNELIGILKKILVNLNPETDNSDVLALINKVISNQVVLPKAIQLMTESIVNKLESLRKVENNNWLFQVKRDDSGLITHVVAINK